MNEALTAALAFLAVCGVLVVCAVFGEEFTDEDPPHVCKTGAACVRVCEPRAVLGVTGEYCWWRPV